VAILLVLDDVESAGDALNSRFGKGIRRAGVRDILADLAPLDARPRQFIGGIRRESGLAGEGRPLDGE